ncbi:undecaprenyl-diphosphate phosphatase [Borrelia hermsii]|uniref:Undecaprenyl-diphosphatase n=3 Tax=Borrelia hermsii TaxID=140 RepID=UPPP_BORHD|nr:undecaprenyl-diphosphate phosphatase [Borrelia hermsii]B2RZW9.1 RecName: Full=Undecaprenyl-diphosphatase; AltName: Full=Bacitracin resistance protein; AltName: Full=Undecaprenyl pyrophosphate phosphatase [Borrelia hermsii DAH]AAX16775.1 bacitracin resistance protein [Borrelia hermsii DAH]AMR75570.1 Undecaprenyl-diphosphatase (Bacitracin resistance protein) [Borrelia hermsii]ANA43074.1 undecaprenyl-diphosphatase [Borrelia hermsii HS1]UPA07597.1 undecaprenyl-diphosphate phosphatase [Borrelia 
MENVLRVVILGFIQGIAEFLPISSSGHLLLLKKFMHIDLPIVFDIYLHLATVLVVMIYYCRRILELVAVLVKFVLGKTTECDFAKLRLILLILIITIITAFIGIFIEMFKGLFTLNLVLINFIVTSILLFLLESRIVIFDLKRNILLAGCLIGTMQGIGAMPGISRSGITIFASVLLGFSRSESFEISFLSLIPIVFGSLLLKYKELFESDMLFSIFEINLGAIIAFLVGLFSISLFVKMLQDSKLYYFSVYLIILVSLVYFLF